MHILYIHTKKCRLRASSYMCVCVHDSPPHTHARARIYTHTRAHAHTQDTHTDIQTHMSRQWRLTYVGTALRTHIHPPACTHVYMYQQITDIYIYIHTSALRCTHIHTLPHAHMYTCTTCRLCHATRGIHIHLCVGQIWMILYLPCTVWWR